MPRLRRTKILATLGPATDRPGVLERLFEAGVDAVRLNFSHGTTEELIQRVEATRTLSKRIGRYVGILVDLQGPKIRIAGFRKGKVKLLDGQRFVLDIGLGEGDGDETTVGCLYRTLPGEVDVGYNILLDDGRLELAVEKVEGQKVICKVIVGGELSDNKGINLKGGGLFAPALTEKDKEHIKIAAELKVDFVAVSFPRNGADIEQARRLLKDAGGSAAIVGKFERAEALNAIDEIMEASDAVMVARGDLGVEIGDAALPAVQKDLINKARGMDKAIITATQMMESMVNNTLPTRAEVFDVANAVFDGTDAVMLSAETAAGSYPVKAVKAMHRICREAENQRQLQSFERFGDVQFGRTDEAIAKSAMFVANHFEIKAIVAYTETGSTPLWMSRVRSSIPIFAFTQHDKTCRLVTLFRGVYPIVFDLKTTDHAELNQEVINKLKVRGLISVGDRVIITKGDLSGVKGGTNAMKIVQIGEGLVE